MTYGKIYGPTIPLALGEARPAFFKAVTPSGQILTHEANWDIKEGEIAILVTDRGGEPQPPDEFTVIMSADAEFAIERAKAAGGSAEVWIIRASAVERTQGPPVTAAQAARGE